MHLFFCSNEKCRNTKNSDKELWGQRTLEELCERTLDIHDFPQNSGKVRTLDIHDFPHGRTLDIHKQRKNSGHPWKRTLKRTLDIHDFPQRN